jgi:thymidylate kinase
MGIIPIDERNHLLRINNDTDALVARSEQPVPPEGVKELRTQLRHLQNKVSHHLEKIALHSRILIVEGISGSGKDTFQTYLKTKFRDRDVYDYSEGEVLHSWKQLEIKGVLKLRVKFMKLFVNHMRDIVLRDENAVYLLNRFHLSTYASTIIQQPKLEKEYDEIINVLRTLPVHIFILKLDENEIEKRSLHPERSGAWQKFQEQIAGGASFRERLETQQRVILEAAEKQQIPYSVIKLHYQPEIEARQIRISKAPTIFRGGVRVIPAEGQISGTATSATFAERVIKRLIQSK